MREDGSQRIVGMARESVISLGVRLAVLWARVVDRLENHVVVVNDGPQDSTAKLAADAGCRAGFVPIKAIGRAAHSHINPLTDTWRWRKWWRGLPVCAKIQESDSACLRLGERHSQIP